MCIRDRTRALRQVTLAKRRYRLALELQVIDNGPGIPEAIRCLLYTSDAADERSSVDLGGRRIIKKKKTQE